MIDEALLAGEEKMQKAVEVAREELAGVRTGRANPAMFSGITVDYYGSPTPLNQLASINVPEARMVIIKPYDASQLKAVETAIRLAEQPDAMTRLSRLDWPAVRAAYDFSRFSTIADVGGGHGQLLALMLAIAAFRKVSP